MRPRKDVTPVQQLALPGPTSKPLALPAPDPVLALPAPKTDVVTIKPIKDGPYIKNGKPNGRPSPSGKSKLDFERAVYEAQVDSDGILRDPNTKEVIDWKPGEPRKGIADFGHIQGKSYKKTFESYKNGVLTLEELKAFQSNPANFQIEVPKSNRSHKYE